MIPSLLGLSLIDVAKTTTPANGILDATNALQYLFSTGKDLWLEPGKTYLVSRPLQMIAGQVLYGNGATLKRAAQLSTTTTATITHGVTTSLAVASSTGFEVGMRIVVSKGTIYSYNGLSTTGDLYITEIRGNTLYLSTAINLHEADGSNEAAGPLTGTTTVYTGFHLLRVASDCRVIDLKIDGNRSNWTFAKWYSTSEIDVDAALRAQLLDCKISEAPGEGILTSGANDLRMERCYLENIRGNGIHMGGDQNVWIGYNTFKNCNLSTVSGTSVDHQDGCICWSNLTGDTIVIGNYMENGRSAIGSIDYDQNSDVTIIGNTMRDCREYGMMDMLGGVGNASANRLIIEGNRIYSTTLSNYIAVGTNDTGASFMAKNIIFRGNLLYNTYLLARNVKDSIFEGNTFDHQAASDTLMAMDNLQDSLIAKNTFRKANKAIDLQSISSKHVQIEGNVCTNQFTSGVWVSEDDCPGIRISANTVSNDSTADTGYYGIVLRKKTVASNNEVDIVKGHSGIYHGTANSYSHGNTVRSGAATYSIRMDGATTGHVCQNNYTTAAVSNGGGGSNTVRTNEVIA